MGEAQRRKGEKGVGGGRRCTEAEINLQLKFFPVEEEGEVGKRFAILNSCRPTLPPLIQVSPTS